MVGESPRVENPSPLFSISNSTITGSVVSKSGLNIVNSSITKGDLPPIYGTPYGLEGMVIPGSYLEY